MFTTNTHNYALQRAGSIPVGDINLSVHDHLLQKAVLSQGSGSYQPIQVDSTPINIRTWLAGLAANLIWKIERMFTRTEAAH